MSKAADRSRRVSDVTLPFSILSKISFSTFKRAHLVKWTFLYADANYYIRRDANNFSNIFDIKLRFETGR